MAGPANSNSIPFYTAAVEDPLPDSSSSSSRDYKSYNALTQMHYYDDDNEGEVVDLVDNIDFYEESRRQAAIALQQAGSYAQGIQRAIGTNPNAIQQATAASKSARPATLKRVTSGQKTTRQQIKQRREEGDKKVREILKSLPSNIGKGGACPGCRGTDPQGNVVDAAGKPLVGYQQRPLPGSEILPSPLITVPGDIGAVKRDPRTGELVRNPVPLQRYIAHIQQQQSAARPGSPHYNLYKRHLAAATLLDNIQKLPVNDPHRQSFTAAFEYMQKSIGPDAGTPENEYFVARTAILADPTKKGPEKEFLIGALEQGYAWRVGNLTRAEIDQRLKALYDNAAEDTWREGLVKVAGWLAPEIGHFLAQRTGHIAAVAATAARSPLDNILNPIRTNEFRSKYGMVLGQAVAGIAMITDYFSQRAQNEKLHKPNPPMDWGVVTNGLAKMGQGLVEGILSGAPCIGCTYAESEIEKTLYNAANVA